MVKYVWSGLIVRCVIADTPREWWRHAFICSRSTYASRDSLYSDIEHIHEFIPSLLKPQNSKCLFFFSFFTSSWKSAITFFLRALSVLSRQKSMYSDLFPRNDDCNSIRVVITKIGECTRHRKESEARNRNVSRLGVWAGSAKYHRSSCCRHD